MSTGQGQGSGDAGGAGASPTGAGRDLVGRTLLDRYRVESVIGKGGMGTVYLARDERLARPVVVKVPHPSLLADAGFVERFQREIKSLTALEHPHVVKVMDAGAVGDVPFAVLQYLPGQSLASRVKERGGRMKPDEVLEWLPDVADALDYIHRRGMVHRDVKPGNVLFDAEGHVFLADFGIAKAISTRDTGLTVTGQTPGSPDYMAPESIKAGPVTAAYDQFSLAVVVYEALAGKLPFQGETPIDSLVVKQTHAARPLKALAPGVPEVSALAVMRALEKEPAKRFPSCGTFADAFTAGLSMRAAVGAVSDESMTLGFGAPRTRVRGAAAAAEEAPPDPSATRVLTKPPARGKKKGGALATVVVVLLLAVAGVAGVAVFAPGLLGAEGPTVTIASPADGALVKTAEVEVRGKVSDVEATVWVADRTAEVAADGSFAVSLPLATDREYRIVVTAKNSSDVTKVPVRVTRDATPPSLAFDLRVDTPGTPGARPPRVAGKAEDAHLAEVRVNGTPVSVAADGTFEAPVAPGAEGEVVAEVEATDRAGNSTKDRATTQAVALVAVEGPAEGAFVASRDVQVTGTAKGAPGVRVNGAEAKVEGGRFVATVRAPDDGPFEVRVEAGPAAASNVVRKIIVDSTPPSLVVTDPAGAIAFVAGTTAKVRGKATDVNLAEVRLDGKVVTADASGAFEAEVPVAEGPPVTVAVTAVDRAGNASPAVRRTIGRGAPAAIAIDEPKEGALLGTRDVKVSGSAKGATPKIVVNGVEASVVGERFSAVVKATADGALVLTATSAPGTPLESSASRSVEVDSTAPRIEITDPVAAVETYAAPTATVRGRVVDAHLAELRMDGKVVPVDALGQFKVPVTLRLDDAVTVAFQATDRLGHSSMKVHRSLKYEPAGGGEVAPKVEIVEPAAGSSMPNGSKVVVRGRLVSTSLSGKFFVSWQGAAPAIVNLAADGAFSAVLEMQVDPSRLPYGVKIVVEGQDGAGRHAVASTTFTLVTPPKPGIPAWAKVSKAQVLAAEKLNVPVAVENELGMRFVLIPPGTFTMGSPAGEPGHLDDEAPHAVTITNAFYLQITEVTNAQYRRFRPAHDSGKEKGAKQVYDLNEPDLPVANVSWDEAMDLVKWLRSGANRRAYRLPSEAEWEYAARGGTQGRFWWGDVEGAAGKYANTFDKDAAAEGWAAKDVFPTYDGRSIAAPVGSYPPNPWGIHDAIGNVFEWCMDWYAAHPPGGADPFGPKDGKTRVMRGGAWTHGPTRSRLAFRRDADPTKPFRDVGFRLVMGAGR